MARANIDFAILTCLRGLKMLRGKYLLPPVHFLFDRPVTDPTKDHGNE